MGAAEAADLADVAQQQATIGADEMGIVKARRNTGATQ
jgi:hypothetical protein